MPVGVGQQKYGIVHGWRPPSTHTGAFSQCKFILKFMEWCNARGIFPGEYAKA
jgi:hypothetical protein